MRESALEAKIKAKIQKKGGLCLKWVSPGFSGVPDRIALLPEGKILFIEVKRPGLSEGRSTRQKRVASQLKNLGFEVIRVSDIGDLDEYI